MRRCLVACLAFVAWASICKSVSAEALTASRLGDSVFRDVWHAILEEAGIEAELVSAPRDVRRDMFVRGELVLDCCSVEAWRSREDEKQVQLWSKPFFYTVDHLILQKGRTYDIPDVMDLTGFRVAVVQGFAYREGTRFGVVVERVSLGEVFDAVATGAADITISNHQEFRRRQKLEPRPIVLGPQYHRLALKARVHNSRPDLLARLDGAIARLMADGHIAKLTGARLRAQ